MTTTEQDRTARALAREWLGTRILVMGGFAAALAVAVYFAIWGTPLDVSAQPGAQETAQSQANSKAALQLCSMALSAAKNFGIVPQYGRLASSEVGTTDVQGRYVCLAATPAAKYTLAVDLVCRNLGDPRCVSLYNVTQSDGTVLYQRQS